MSDPVIDDVILLSREADEYMMRCEPDKAKPLYQKASDLLRTRLLSEVRSLYERTAITYSAALLCFKAGNYNDAQALASQVNVQHIHKIVDDASELYTIAKERCGSIYNGQVVKEIAKLEERMKKGDKEACKAMILVLRENPYAVRPAKMARLRYEALKTMGREEEAAMFLPDMERLERKKAEQYAI